MTKLEIFLTIVLIVLFVIFIEIYMQNHNLSDQLHKLTDRKPDGRLLIGRNRYSKKVVYRFDFDIALEDVPNHTDLLFKVERTNDNLGINERLYDLSEEGLNDDYRG